MQRIWEASEYLAVLLARYTRIEALYHRVQVSNATELGDAIVNVYICVHMCTTVFCKSEAGSYIEEIRYQGCTCPMNVVNTDYLD